MRFEAADRTKTSEQLVDVAIARSPQPKGRHRLLQEAYGWPSLTASGLVCAFEKEKNVIDEKSTRLDEQPDQERIAVIHLEKGIEVCSAGFREPRMVEDVLDCDPQRAPQQALDLGPFQACPFPESP